MKKKSEATEALHAIVRFYKSMNIIIGTIRNDQGGEYGGHHERATSEGGNSNSSSTVLSSTTLLSSLPASSMVSSLNSLRHIGLNSMPLPSDGIEQS